MTKDGQCPLPAEAVNCTIYVTVTDEEVNASVKIIPKIETLVSGGHRNLSVRPTILRFMLDHCTVLVNNNNNNSSFILKSA